MARLHCFYFRRDDACLTAVSSFQTEIVLVYFSSDKSVPVFYLFIYLFIYKHTDMQTIRHNDREKHRNTITPM